MMSPSIPAPLNLSSFQTTTCLHFLLRCWWLHHRRRRTGGPTRRIFLPNIVGHWANVIHRLSAPNNPSQGAAVWPEFVAKKTACFLEKEKQTKWFETAKKMGMILFFEPKFTETIIRCVCISILYIWCSGIFNAFNVFTQSFDPKL